MPEVIARAAQVLAALGGAYLIALWFVLVVWTYRDIEARSKNVVTQVVSTLLVVLFFVLGVLLYMILRPKETLDASFQRSLEEEYLLQDLEELPLCPSCQRYIEDAFRLCPHCHAQLREPCVVCERLVELTWSLCPYCAAPQHGREVDAETQVEAPAARWISPDVLKRRKTQRSLEPALPVVPAARPVQPAALAGAMVEEPGAADAAPTVQLPASLRPFTRPFDRLRGKDRDDEVAVEAERPAVASNGSVPTVVPQPRGRFQPFDTKLGTKPTNGTSNREPANGNGADRSHQDGESRTVALVTNDDPSTTDSADKRTLVKTSGEGD